VVPRITVAAWNVDHQIYAREIPTPLVEALLGINADVIFLSEFVDSGDSGRDRLRIKLHEAGYTTQALAPAPDRYKGPRSFYNRIFAASKLPFDIGDIAPPTTDEFATSNYIHLRLRDSDIELIGLRVPLWDRAEAYKNAPYRDELTKILRTAAQHRALVVAGDWNKYKFKQLEGLYSVPEPEGPWSYMNSRGNNSRLDFAAHTKSVRVGGARYIYEVAGTRIAPKPLSDHAALWFTAELT
jgi:endonuclease/exonuclease/phosphatase family metal-dependent hydrolase